MKFRKYFIVLFSAIIILLVLLIFKNFFPQTLKNILLGQENKNSMLPSNISAEYENTATEKLPSSEKNVSVSDNTAPIEIPRDTVPEYDFYFELPINGATGYASIALKVVDKPNSNSVVKKLSPGDAFQIMDENKNWLKIKINSIEGWVDSTYCMINLPDVIPSIIYDDTNSYKSLFHSSYIAIPNITGEQLYDVYTTNNRLGKKQFMMPVIYAMAKKIMQAQKLALEDGYSLKIYETYRPYETQRKVCTNLKTLLSKNKKVYNGIYGGGWSEDWFINQSVSNHQRGIAMDVSLVKIDSSKVISIGKYYCLLITNYTEEKMPTPMHELSDKSVTFKQGVASTSKTAWKTVELATTMTSGSIRLQNYCTQAELTPLASEWWHFNDLDARAEIGSHYSTGKYKITNCYSTIPQ